MEASPSVFLSFLLNWMSDDDVESVLLIIIIPIKKHETYNQLLMYILIEIIKFFFVIITGSSLNTRCLSMVAEQEQKLNVTYFRRVFA